MGDDDKPPMPVEAVAEAVLDASVAQSTSALNARNQPNQSSTDAAVHDCCMLPSGSPVKGW